MAVYLDHAATTPLDPEVLEAMLPYLREHYGNPSSPHALGRRARHAVEEARERVAAVLGCAPAEVLFTSGGTEADNAALAGVLGAPERRGPGLVTSRVEHEAVLHAADVLAARGHPVDLLTPPPHGAPTPEQVAEAINPETGLVSVMFVNNETGAQADLPAIAAVCRAHGVPLHTDAVQGPAVLRIDVEALGVDLLSLSGHKVYGPKGSGVLYVRDGTPFEPLIRGGAQERRRRAGTENVAAVVGLAVALERAAERAEAEHARLARLRARLVEGLQRAFGDSMRLNSPLEGFAAPHIVNVSFPPRDGQRVDGEMLLLGLELEGVLASRGSACTSGALEPSHVLRALGVPTETAQATVRLSLGRATDEAAVDRAVEALRRVVARALGEDVGP